MNIGAKVKTTAHDQLAVDYHGLEGVVGNMKMDGVMYGGRYLANARSLYWVDFCGPAWERRSAAHQSGNRLCKGLWIPKDALIPNAL